MSRDVLARALKAYRVESDQGEDRAAETLRRILDSRPRRRRLRPLVLFSVLVCSAAAAAGIRELPRLTSWFRGATAKPARFENPPASPGLGGSPAGASSVGAGLGMQQQSPGSPGTMSAAGLNRLAPVPTVSVSPVPSSTPHPARRRRLVAAASAGEPPSRPELAPEAGSMDPQDVLFEQARKAHDSVSIEDDLVGWERYLNSYPDGRFAPEARYRRALALARLGRGTEALSAFLWFTDNAEGKYRREDALRWIRALSQEP